MDTIEYDLICSLGANCSASNELKLRGLRQIALPFDWTWFNSVDALNCLAAGFKNNFSDFMKKENLEKLEGKKYSSWHSDRIQFLDKATNFKYYNHFYKTEDEEAEIDRVIALFRKRCDRLDFFLKNSKKVLFILSVICDLPTDAVKNLLNTIQEVYPDCEINIYFQAFDCEKDEYIELPHLKIARYKRKENVYDYTWTNFNWNFLDNLKLSQLFFENQRIALGIQENPTPPPYILCISKLKKGLSICLLPQVNTIFYTKLYLFGIRLHLTLGKNRIE